MQNFTKGRGFTLIELLIVIGIIAILAGVVIVALNPARQFAQARDTERVSNLNSILNAIGQNMADNKGIFTCSSGATIPTVATGTISSGGLDLRAYLVPTYMAELPVDPSVGCAYNSAACPDAYNTQYAVIADANGRVHVLATTTEPSIPRLSALEVVR